MSLFRGLYTSGLFKCSIAFLIYSSLSSTTIVEPLSGLLSGFSYGFIFLMIVSFLVRLLLLVYVLIHLKFPI